MENQTIYLSHGWSHNDQEQFWRLLLFMMVVMTGKMSSVAVESWERPAILRINKSTINIPEQTRCTALWLTLTQTGDEFAANNALWVTSRQVDTRRRHTVVFV